MLINENRNLKSPNLNPLMVHHVLWHQILSRRINRQSLLLLIDNNDMLLFVLSHYELSCKSNTNNFILLWWCCFNFDCVLYIMLTYVWWYILDTNKNYIYIYICIYIYMYEYMYVTCLIKMAHYIYVNDECRGIRDKGETKGYVSESRFSHEIFDGWDLINDT